MSYTTDVTIIGAGPVGLFAIFECGMMRLKCHVIDTLDMVGGQCSALYPEKPIYDIPAYPCITAQELIFNLKEQASPFKPVYHLGTQVIGIERKDNNVWSVSLSNGTSIESKVIIIAAGVGAFGPNRPPLIGLEQYEEKSIFYYVKRREDFRDKRIVIAGGGDSAVDWAISLSEVASNVKVVHRRSKFRASPESEAKLHELAQKGAIELIIPYQLDRLEGQDGLLSKVIVKTLEGEEKILETDFLLPFFGLSMNLGPIAEWGLNLERNHIVVDPTTYATNAPGIFAIGDIATYPNKLKLILTGFAEAAQAAHTARKIIHPEEVWHFEYSTTQGVQGLA
jgi:thioredoxin reductase (NADPH)